MALAELGHQRGGGAGVGEVEPPCLGAELGRELAGRFGARPVGEDDAASASREHACHRAAERARSAGDERNALPVAEIRHHASQCNIVSSGLRGPGLKSVPIVYATGISAACMTSS